MRCPIARPFALSLAPSHPPPCKRRIEPGDELPEMFGARQNVDRGLAVRFPRSISGK